METLNKHVGVGLKDEEGSFLINCSDIPRCHWILETKDVKVVINANQCGNEPAFLIRNDRLFIGAEQRVYVIHVGQHQILSPNYQVSNVQWIEKENPDKVIIACEDELIALDNFGTLCWRRNLPDIIRTTEIRSGKIYVSDMAGEEYEFEI